MRWRVDFVWLEQRLVVEADSWQFHRSRASFERDHTNTADLKRAGFEVQRVTWRQMQDQPLALVADIAASWACSFSPVKDPAIGEILVQQDDWRTASRRSASRSRPTTRAATCCWSGC